MKIAASVTSAGPIRVRACVFPVLFAALLSGCSLWGGSKVKLPELGENVPLLGVRQAWSAKVGGGGAKPLDVRVQEHLVTIAAADGSVAALDARTGGDLWRTNVGEPLSAGVGTDGRYAAVVSHANALVLLDQGKEVWRQTLPSQVFTAPLIAGGRVFVLAADRSVSAFDLATGKKLWSQARTGGDALVLKQSGVILAVGDTLVVGAAGLSLIHI